eukprot:398695-Rhodomonas_salina.1
MAVVMPDTHVAAGVVVEACSVVPPFSRLAPPHSRWHGNPARPRSAPAEPPTPSAGATGSLSDPWSVTRAAVPLLVLAAVAGGASAATRVVPAVDAQAEVGSWGLVWLAVSYLAVLQLSGVLLLLLTLLLKWSFLSPFLTDRFAAVLLSTFFPYIEKTLLVQCWHRAFGMRIGPRSSVLLVRLCAPSAAHRCAIGQDTLLFNGFLAPPDPPTLWSWLAGRTCHPWASGTDIEIGDNVGVFVQCRLEGKCVVGDGAQCGAFARAETGATVPPSHTLLGDPALHIRYARDSAAEKPGPEHTPHVQDKEEAARGSSTMRVPDQGGRNAPPSKPEVAQRGPGAGLTVLHVVLFALRLAYLASVATCGVQAMLWLDSGGRLSPYLRVPLRLALAIAWLLAGLMGEVLVCKWAFVGRALPEEFAVVSVKGVLHAHLAACESALHALLAAFCHGLWPLDVYLRLLGFRLPVGRVLLLSGNYAAADAELVELGAGCVLDDNSYLIAHQADTRRLLADRARVGPRSVLHPQAVLFFGSVDADSQLFPRCKAAGALYGGPGQTWAGCPARAVPVETVGPEELARRRALATGEEDAKFGQVSSSFVLDHASHGDEASFV